MLANAHIIAQGYARALTGFAFDKDYKDQFVRLQQEARVARRGLWAIGPDGCPLFHSVAQDHKWTRA